MKNSKPAKSGGMLSKQQKPVSDVHHKASLIPKSAFTSTVCHEIAHQIGIGPESEANFIGYLAAINSSDSFFQYGSYLNALRYCLNEINYTNPEKFEELKASLNIGILKDLQQNQEFWESYQNWSEKYFKTC